PFAASSRCFSSTSFIWNTSRSSASPAGPGAPPPSSAGIVDAVVACYLRQRESNRAETRGKVTVESGYAACSTWDFEDDNHDYGCTRLGEHSKRQLGQGDDRPLRGHPESQGHHNLCAHRPCRQRRGCRHATAADRAADLRRSNGRHATYAGRANYWHR